MIHANVRLANLEAGGRDDSEFIRWQEEMKQVDQYIYL